MAMTRATGAHKPHEGLTTAVFSRTLRGRLSHLIWLYVRNARRAYLAWRNKDQFPPDIREIGAALVKEGLVIDEAGRLLSPQGSEALSEASARIFERLQTDELKAILRVGKNDRQSKDYLIHVLPPATVHDASSPYLKLALDPKLLGIVATYFGLWPKLHSIGSWLNMPTADEAKFSQLWHRDPADLKLLKVFIYLEPVGEDNGPFSFIPRTHPFGADSTTVPRHEHRRRITDKEMSVAFPESRWVKCVGPANTMVLADTVGFHRGGKVEQGRRLLITLTYTSGSPKESRELHVAEVPAWATLPIQKSALEGVVT
jgi:hypothetical protein